MLLRISREFTLEFPVLMIGSEKRYAKEAYILQLNLNVMTMAPMHQAPYQLNLLLHSLPYQRDHLLQSRRYKVRRLIHSALILLTGRIPLVMSALGTGHMTSMAVHFMEMAPRETWVQQKKIAAIAVVLT